MDHPVPPAAPAALSPAILARAPHRLLFFIGAANVLLAMLWWTLWLVDARWHAIGLPQPQVYGGWIHAIVMQYQVLAPFMFGFLLTVFPRWMGLDDIGRWHYVPVGVGLFGGQLSTLAGAFVEARCVDEVVAYLAPKLLGDGPHALGEAGIETIGEAVTLVVDDVERFGDDLKIVGRPVWPEGE